MSVKFRFYKLLADFDKVIKYLTDVYNIPSSRQKRNKHKQVGG